MEYITHVETNKRTLFWTFIRYIRYAMSFLCLNMQKKTGKQQKEIHRSRLRHIQE